MLVSLQAGSVEGAGLELAVPGDPQLIRCADEGREVSKPHAGHGGRRIHVEGAVDDAPCVAHICRGAQHVFAEQRRVRIVASHVCGQPPGSEAPVQPSVIFLLRFPKSIIVQNQVPFAGWGF